MKDEDVRKGTAAGLLAIPLAALLWVGIILAGRWTINHPGFMAQVAVLVLLLIGSGLILRACVELDK